MGAPIIDTELPPEAAPEPPPKGPWVWAKDNLFYSAFSSVLTVLSFVVVVLFFRGILGFVFAEGRGWDSVATNMRLYMTQAYPEDNYFRVWVALSVILALSGLSLAIWRTGGRMIVQKLIRGFLGAGGFLLFVGVVALGTIPAEPAIGFIVVGAVLLGIGLAAQQSLGDRAKEMTVPTLSIAFAALTLILIGIWTIPIGDYRFIEGQVVEETGRTIAMSTKLPLTIVSIVLVAAYLVGKAVRDRLPGDSSRTLLLLGWVMSMPTIILIILRAPDWGDVEWGRDIVVFLAFAVAGALLLMVLTNPGIGEPGRIIAGAVLIVAVAAWGISMLMLIRFLLLALAGFALAAPTFAGEMRQRVRYAVTWVVTIVPIIFFLALVDTASTLEITGTSFLGGLALTFVLAIVGIILSFPIGVAMALGRTSTMPIFRVVSTVYIEVVRGIPFITVLIFADLILELFLPEGISLDDVVQAIAATTFFSAAYLAENVRGGLQSIPKGQYEASKALGMTTFQTTVFIVLPQALRAVVPALVGQTIAIFKDTSLVAIIGLFDLLFIGSKVVPAQTAFLGLLKENLLFVAAVYWIFTFAFSRASLRIEKKLGLGTR